jgi:hypothetical protein
MAVVLRWILIKHVCIRTCDAKLSIFFRACARACGSMSFFRAMYKAMARLFSAKEACKYNRLPGNASSLLPRNREPAKVVTTLPGKRHVSFARKVWFEDSCPSMHFRRRQYVVLDCRPSHYDIYTPSSQFRSI